MILYTRWDSWRYLIPWGRVGKLTNCIIFFCWKIRQNLLRLLSTVRKCLVAKSWSIRTVSLKECQVSPWLKCSMNLCWFLCIKEKLLLITLLNSIISSSLSSEGTLTFNSDSMLFLNVCADERAWLLAWKLPVTKSLQSMCCLRSWYLQAFCLLDFTILILLNLWL